LGNGSNFIGIEAINGQFITSVTLTSLQGISSSPIIEDVRQIRISGETLTPDSGPLPNLPEPASLVIWCMSGLGLVAARWARTRSSAGAPTVGAAS
jgi:hypothetical protein